MFIHRERKQATGRAEKGGGLIVPSVFVPQRRVSEVRLTCQSPTMPHVSDGLAPRLSTSVAQPRKNSIQSKAQSGRARWSVVFLAFVVFFSFFAAEEEELLRDRAERNSERFEEVGSEDE